MKQHEHTPQLPRVDTERAIKLAEELLGHTVEVPDSLLEEIQQVTGLEIE